MASAPELRRRRCGCLNRHRDTPELPGYLAVVAERRATACVPYGTMADSKSGLRLPPFAFPELRPRSMVEHGSYWLDSPPPGYPADGRGPRDLLGRPMRPHRVPTRSAPRMKITGQRRPNGEPMIPDMTKPPVANQGARSDSELLGRGALTRPVLDNLSVHLRGERVVGLPDLAYQPGTEPVQAGEHVVNGRPWPCSRPGGWPAEPSCRP